jgi:predicted lipoprotein with Yx(FWY)xxD motif
VLRNRIALLLGTLAIVPLASAMTATSASAATLELRKTAVGEIITDSAGMTVFMFTRDTRKFEACVTISGCTEVWPPIFAEETPTVGPGLKAKKLGTLALPNGSHQLTYKKHPLYGYTGNVNPGETSYIGALAFGGYWYGLNAKGQPVL